MIKIKKHLITVGICLLVYVAMAVPIYGRSGITIVNSLIQLAFGTTFTSTFDTATPAGTDDPSEADDRMREIKAAVQERENVDHYWPLTGTEVSDADAGEHRKITFHESISDPTQVASHSHLYMQSDELRYQDDTNSGFDITSGGNLGSASTSILANGITVTSGTTNVGISSESSDAGASFRLFDNGTTGGQESALSRTSDVLTLSPNGGDNRLLTSTASATANDRQIADKGYVDTKEATLVTQATASVFGSRTTNSTAPATLVKDAIYKAQCDGIIFATNVNASDVQIFSNSSNPPTGTLVGGSVTSTYQATAGIRKDDYVEVNCTSATVIRWLPIGTGGLVVQ